MRSVAAKDITSRVKDLCMNANYDLGEDVISAFERALKREDSDTGREIIKRLMENAAIAREDRVPICQDTGLAVFFVRKGQEVKIEGGLLRDAINEGVRQGYEEGYLRKSACDPLTRKNTGDNTPVIIHLSEETGDRLRITFAPKGGGSENMSRVAMLKPADGIEGIKAFVVRSIKEAGGNPCPPIVVGVGIGGTFEKCAILAKESLMRSIGTRNPDDTLAGLEDELLEEINKLGVGPMGLGGRTTALAVHIMKYPCHIASLPVALNIQCHAARHKEVVV